MTMIGSLVTEMRVQLRPSSNPSYYVATPWYPPVVPDNLNGFDTKRRDLLSLNPLPEVFYNGVLRVREELYDGTDSPMRHAELGMGNRHLGNWTPVWWAQLPDLAPAAPSRPMRRLNPGDWIILEIHNDRVIALDVAPLQQAAVKYDIQLPQANSLWKNRGDGLLYKVVMECFSHPPHEEPMVVYREATKVSTTWVCSRLDWYKDFVFYANQPPQ